MELAVAQGGMVGRVYRWRGDLWRVVCRWRSLQSGDPVTWVCSHCGHIVVGDDTPDYTLGDVGYCGACDVPWPEAERICVGGWEPGGGGTMRNVLLEKLVPWIELVPTGAIAQLLPAPWSRLVVRGESWELIAVGRQDYCPNGERVVRPFRGLRRA